MAESDRRGVTLRKDAENHELRAVGVTADMTYLLCGSGSNCSAAIRTRACS